ncbi:MAG: hypothetical protein KatS3mg115_1890 [Candidatus Poribacteria bacterium]|nr:MAG: hypothetical protein KatS3mg115_1890 [Candidatus Poribacteria bacterium]
MTIEAVDQLLAPAIAPVALISGVGLLILSMTNRFGRVADRVREIGQAGFLEELDRKQIEVLYRRATALRSAVVFATVSVLAVAWLIVGNFLLLLLGRRTGWLTVALFTLSLGCLILSLCFFLYDVGLSLRALRWELVGRNLLSRRGSSSNGRAVRR